jgi:transposase
MALILLPPYIPELNRVEHIRESIRENLFRNEVFNGIDGVENQPEKALAARKMNGRRCEASPDSDDWLV